MLVMARACHGPPEVGQTPGALDRQVDCSQGPPSCLSRVLPQNFSAPSGLGAQAFLFPASVQDFFP